MTQNTSDDVKGMTCCPKGRIGDGHSCYAEALDKQKNTDSQELKPCPFPTCEGYFIQKHSKDENGGISIECGNAVHYIHPKEKGRFRSSDKGASNVQ